MELTFHKIDTAAQAQARAQDDARQHPADPSERINFACRQCGGCCTNTTPYVTPLDVWRLARALDTSTSDIISKRLIIIETSLSGVGNMGRVPLLALKMTGRPGSLYRSHSRSSSRFKQCIFLKRETHRCIVYGSRPLSCRMFPAGLQYLADGDKAGGARACSNGDEGDGIEKYHFVMVKPLPECAGYGAGNNTLQQYLNGEVHDDDLDCWRQYTELMLQVFQGNDLAANEDFADSFLAAIFDLDGRDGADFRERFEQGRNLVMSWLA